MAWTAAQLPNLKSNVAEWTLLRSLLLLLHQRKQTSADMRCDASSHDVEVSIGFCDSR
jgi:hypothetical protein